MGLFGKMFGKVEKYSEKEDRTSGSKNTIESMCKNAEALMLLGQYEKAFATYKQIVELQLDVTAMYNLGSMYAQGKGTKQSFLEAAYWFHQANLAGDERAGKLRTRCLMDYIHQGLNQKSPQTVYEEMLRYAAYLYPRDDNREFAVSRLYELAEYHKDKEEYAVAAKLYRAAAEFGNHGSSQNFLAVFYNAAAGVEKDDLVALYWFDRAVDNRVEVSKRDRNGILNAYKTNLSPKDFYNTMMLLSQRCAAGDEDIPKDAEKAAYWRRIAEGR